MSLKYHFSLVVVTAIMAVTTFFQDLTLTGVITLSGLTGVITYVCYREVAHLWVVVFLKITAVAVILWLLIDPGLLVAVGVAFIAAPCGVVLSHRLADIS